MDKKRLIAAVKLSLIIASVIVAIIAVIVSLGASVAWVTGWSLVKGSVAILIGVIVSAGAQLAIRDI